MERDDPLPTKKDVLLLVMKYQAGIADKPSLLYYPASFQSFLGVPASPFLPPPSKGKQVDFDFSSNLHYIVHTHKINYHMYNAKHADPTLSLLVDREPMVVLLILMPMFTGYLIEKLM